MPILAQQTYAIVRVDGHRRGAARVAHDFQRQAYAIGQVHGIDAHLDDAPVEDFFPLEQHCASVRAVE
jgi:hypothetical protein